MKEASFCPLGVLGLVGGSGSCHRVGPRQGDELGVPGCREGLGQLKAMLALALIPTLSRTSQLALVFPAVKWACSLMPSLDSELQAPWQPFDVSPRAPKKVEAAIRVCRVGIARLPPGSQS